MAGLVSSASLCMQQEPMAPIFPRGRKDETTRPAKSTLIYPNPYMLTCNAPIPAFPRVHMDGAAANALANACLETYAPINTTEDIHEK
ncbi:uncharacterized protein G2W53_030430 [Senna tora]|uniref:Uncharacterized protein n=1 Tax=Senna tora TaxID=362788 RepID=A0A834T7F2_9FABA|nr:uncharacterized protein G2W53_030430 [Senna tora]